MLFMPCADALANAFIQFGQVNAPPVHTSPFGHACTEPPQFFRSVPMLTSQPSFGSPLQSEKPIEQLWSTHTPAVQASTPFGGFLHELPQLPQLAASMSVLVSQPSIGSPL